MVRTAAPLAFLLTAACGLPSEQDLTGVWVNLEMGTLRVYEFDDSLDAVSGGPAYNLYLYAGGTTPIVVQNGTYATERTSLDAPDGASRPALVTSVQFSSDPSQEGQTYASELTDFESDLSFVLAAPDGPNGLRTFTWSDRVP